MEIRLSPELAAIVEQDVAHGGYTSAEEYVAEAIQSMHEHEDWLEEERAKLEQSLAEAHRGDVFTEEEVREYMRQRKAEFARRQSAA